MKRTFFLLLTALICALALPACAQEYDAQTAHDWLDGFARTLASLQTLNDPQATVDPARAGQMLIEYEFGTVTATEQNPNADSILEIDIRTAQVADCRGMRVGMSLDELLSGFQMTNAEAQLYVLSMQDAGIGWSWAYIGESGVYGVEYVTYGGNDATMKEYTLTYVIGGDETISAIRMRVSDSTAAQAEDGFKTAQEIASRQTTEIYAYQNGADAFSQADMQVMGKKALGVSVAELVAILGEPVEVQALPSGLGRILLYEGAAVEIGFDEQTGVEIVRSVSASGTGLTGPRNLRIGMSVQEAAALFACAQNVTSLGGTLYLQGEAAGEPPYGEIAREAGGAVLRYAAATEDGEVVLLEAGIRNEKIAYWHLYYDAKEAEHAA